MIIQFLVFSDIVPDFVEQDIIEKSIVSSVKQINDIPLSLIGVQIGDK
jgi:hypothetical protein